MTNVSSPTSIESPAIAAAPNRFRQRLTVRDMGTLIRLVVIVVVFASLSPVFLSERNLINSLQQSSLNSCVAIGLTMVIISGGIDLSVGPVAACAAVLCATMLFAGYPVLLAIRAGLVVGVLCSAFNGVLIAVAGLQPFIVTLGTLSLFRALALIFTGGSPILGAPNEFRRLFASKIGIFPVPVVAVLVVVASILLARTPLGEYIFAVGGNEEVARLDAAEPTLGNLWELEAIAASAIGGASLMGGKGSIIGTILGAIVLGAMRNGLTLLNVRAFYQLLATGIIIILAMLVDRLTRGKV